MNEQLQQQEPLDRKDLKIMSYRQKVAEQEDQIADLRVELTFAANELEQLRARVAEFEGAEEPDVSQDED